MQVLQQPRWGAIMLAVSVNACAVYSSDLVAPTTEQAGTGGGGAAGATAGVGAVGAGGGDTGGGGNASAGSSGSGGSGGTGEDLTRAYVRGGTRVPPIMVDFTTDGFRDWAHWGLKVAGDYNHKVDGTSQLLDFKPAGMQMHEAKVGSPITFKWSDGTPTTSATTTNGVMWVGLDQGFELVAPAADEERRVMLYIGVTAGSAAITASLSDPAAASRVEDHITSATDVWNMRLLSIDYGFAAPGSELAISVKVSEALDDTAAVALHGVTFGGP